MIFIFTSGIAIPTDSLPEFVQKFAHIFPMYHCIQIMQYLWVGDFELSKIGNNIVYVLILSALMVIILQKVRIQWDSK